MIEELTEQKLIEYGYNAHTIEGILTWDNFADAILRDDNGNYLASKMEQKIYSGDDFYFKTETYMLFPYDNYSIMPAYYDLNLKVFLNKERKIAGNLLNEKKAIERFRQKEIDKAKIGSSKFLIKPHHKKMDVLYTEWLQDKIGINNVQLNDVSDQYIDPDLLPRLREIESKMQPTIQTFAVNKIRCAAWVDLLMDKNYFLKEFENKKAKYGAEFAKYRYNAIIDLQIKATKTKDRKPHKTQLEKFFK